MAATRKLAKFTVTRSGEDFAFHIEDDGGHVLEIGATHDQVDIIADTLDEMLSEDESADEVADDEEDEIEGDDDEVKDEVDGAKR